MINNPYDSPASQSQSDESPRVARWERVPAACFLLAGVAIGFYGTPYFFAAAVSTVEARYWLGSVLLILAGGANILLGFAWLRIRKRFVFVAAIPVIALTYLAFATLFAGLRP